MISTFATTEAVLNEKNDQMDYNENELSIEDNDDSNPNVSINDNRGSASIPIRAGMASSKF